MHAQHDEHHICPPSLTGPCCNQLACRAQALTFQSGTHEQPRPQLCTDFPAETLQLCQVPAAQPAAPGQKADLPQLLANLLPPPGQAASAPPPLRLSLDDSSQDEDENNLQMAIKVSELIHSPLSWLALGRITACCALQQAVHAVARLWPGDFRCYLPV